MPIEKGPGAHVIGGTLNRTGLFRFKATRIGAETALAQIIKMVEEAQASSAPIQRIADQVTGYFVPAVVTVSIVAFAGWWIAGNFPQALLSFIAVLIIWAANGFSLVVLAAAAMVWAALNGAAAWHAQSWPAIAYRHSFYRVDARGIEIRRGVYWRTIINIPRSRVQHTDVSQGPLERTHDLGTLVIYTAGTDHSRVDLPGLAHVNALRIREHLLPREDNDAV